MNEQVIAVKYDENNKQEIKIVDAPKQNEFLEFAYKEIECKLVECVYFDNYDIWVNEEGLFKTGNPVYNYGNFTQLAGNLVITKGVDSKGNTTFFDPSTDAGILLTIMDILINIQYLGEIE